MSCTALSRRRLLVAGMSAVLTSACSSGSVRARPDVDEALAALHRQSGGRLGVHVLDTGTGQSFGIHDDEMFALCSTFKLLLAAAVLHRHEREEDAAWLDRALPFKAKDLVPHSPITERHLPQGSISIRQACHATMTLSDNAAANLLLPLVGGPAGLTSFLRNHCDDPASRLDRMEPELNSNLPGDPRDTTTPRAMARTTGRLLAGDVLTEPSKRQLAAWLESATTGLTRVRAGLPPRWRAGDKTGTGVNGAANDVAVAWPPGQRLPIVIAVYMSGSPHATAQLNQVHAQVGTLVAAHWPQYQGG